MNKNCVYSKACGMEYCRPEIAREGIECPEFAQKPKPILFSTPMVQAILEGRKTMTRRICKLPELEHVNADGSIFGGNDFDNGLFKSVTEYVRYFHLGKYQPGDILWVRETWKPIVGFRDDYEFGEIVNTDEHFGYQYRAGGTQWPDGFEEINDEFHVTHTNDEGEYENHWRPSIFMPREAARIFLRVTDVRVERVNDISEEDAIKEGCQCGDRYSGERSTPALTAKQSFMWLWIRLNDKRGFGWAANPWVFVVSFERCEKPEGI